MESLPNSQQTQPGGEYPEGVPFWISRSFPETFVVDRPYGISNKSPLFLHFRSPVSIRIGVKETTEKAGTCVILKPGTPNRLCGCATSRLIFDGIQIPEKCLPELKALEIPTDEVLRPIRTDFIPFTINQMLMEFERKNRYWQMVVDHSTSLLLALVARYLPNRKSSGEVDPEGEVLIKIQDLARKIDEEVDHDWTVQEMAALMNLSRSRFSTIFTKHIGEPPRDYLINARLRYAIILLTNSSVNVAEAADQSGFQSPYYFSRIFHKRVGCAPSQYKDRFVIG